MKQAGKLRLAIVRLQQRITAATKDKHVGSLFASNDYVDDLIVSVKADLATLPGQIGELQDKGSRLRVDASVLKAMTAIFHGEMLEAGRDFGKMIERHASATKEKESRRSRLDIGRGDGGSVRSLRLESGQPSQVQTNYH